MGKDVLVHLGPHKTGSTSIQKALLEARSEIAAAGVSFLHNERTHRAALSLASEDFEDAELLLRRLSSEISSLPQNHVILSQEDFCGQIPGRTNRRAIYPRLTKNLRILRRSLQPHRVRFLFFRREEHAWIRSCYNQHLKYRTQFSSFDAFLEHYAHDFTWQSKLQKLIEAFGNDLVVLDYERERSSGLQEILSLVAPTFDIRFALNFASSENLSPSPEAIRTLERINAHSEFRETASFAKSLVLSGWKPTQRQGAASNTSPDWPPKPREFIPAKELSALQERSSQRVSKQSIEDILPPVITDLNALALETLPSDAELPDLPRSDIRNQDKILNYHLRGKSRLSHLNALVISYLRRDTPHTEKARALFHRIWSEMGVLLVNELSTRWLISTLQTFMDHGASESQRQIGTAGYFFANMVKIYEGERALEGLPQDGEYENVEPTTPNRFRGMDRFNVGGTDLLLNTNASLLEIANKDEIAGLVLKEFLLRMKKSWNVFMRYDKTRKNRSIEVSGFEDTWSFFEPR